MNYEKVTRIATMYSVSVPTRKKKKCGTNAQITCETSWLDETDVKTSYLAGNHPGLNQSIG